MVLFCYQETRAYWLSESVIICESRYTFQCNTFALLVGFVSMLCVVDGYALVGLDECFPGKYSTILYCTVIQDCPLTSTAKGIPSTASQLGNTTVIIYTQIDCRYNFLR